MNSNLNRLSVLSPWMTADPRRIFEFCCHLCFGVFCSIVLVLALRVTGNFERPYDLDQFRDIGMAQSILAGNYPADYQYIGETNWYNPLAAFIIAAVSRLSGLDAQVADVRSGPWVNLATPVCFYLLACRFFNPFAGLIGVAWLIFGPAYTDTGRASWAQATYSPWLFEPTATLPLFFLTLLIYHKALVTNQWKHYLVAGIFHGLTFFGHAAPALIIGGIAALFTFRVILANWTEDFSSKAARDAFLKFAAMMLAALVVSMPFWLPIWRHYRFKMQNPAHAAWFYNILQLKSIGQFAREQIIWPNLLVAVGLVALWKRSRVSTERVIVLGWLAISVLFLMHNYAWQILSQYGIIAPIVVPTYHFLLYYTAVKAMLFGLGGFVLCRVVVGALLRLFQLRNPTAPTIAVPVVAIALAVATAREFWPSYNRWYELQGVQSYITQRMEEYAGFGSYRWIIKNTRVSDVFGCNEAVASQLVAPTGRKLIWTVSQFSNPYASGKQRVQDNHLLFASIIQGDRDNLLSVASKYGVKRIIATTSETLQLTKGGGQFLHRVYSDDKINIFELLL